MSKPKITFIPPTIDPKTKMPQLSTKKRRVCAYARVSTDSEEQFTSYEAQIDYYTKFIKANPEWQFVDVYTDEGITGTSIKRRVGFNKMIDDALAGMIDLIVTKSVSRFARNTVDSLTTIRKLKEKGIEVYFQKENIYTLDSKGELLVTIMSSLAQEESRSISENVTWGHRKAFSDGKVRFAYKYFLGYEKGPDGKPKVVPEQAEIVKLIYRLYLDGRTVREIAEILDELKVAPPSGKDRWHYSTITSILKNEKYKGDALLQKKFTVDFLEHKVKKNEGEIPQYYVEGSHEWIIEPYIWEAVQVEFARREKSGIKYSSRNPFYSKIICADCGSTYGMKVWHSNEPNRKEVFQCSRKFNKGKPKCTTPTVQPDEIKEAFVKAFNSILINKDGVIDDMKMMIEVLCDLTELDSALERQQLEVEMITDQLRKIVDENASVAQSQEEYFKKYNMVKDIFDKEVAKLGELRAKKAEQISKRKAMESYLAMFIKAPKHLTEWDESIFHMFVENGIMHSNNKIEFVLKNGIRKKVTIK